VTWAAVAVWLASLGAAARADCPLELFRIERSTNENVIVYEVLDPDAGVPVRASWILFGEGGRREELNELETRLAYGFDVERRGQTFRLTLRADRTRAIHLREHAGCLRAFRLIAGRVALLDHLHVEVRDSLIPSVKWVDVFGTDVATGEVISERILPR
jgi:hypothetical protein